MDERFCPLSLSTFPLSLFQKVIDSSSSKIMRPMDQSIKWGEKNLLQLSFIPRRWEEKEKGDNENLANTPVKSSPQGCVLVEQRM